MAMVHAGMAEHGMGWLAREQTAGKGQRGRQWLAEPGQNIVLSLALQPPAAFTHHPFAFSMAVALGVHSFFTALAGDETRLKWPNDLYWRDRKAGGILIENIYTGAAWQWAVAGMGININQTVFDPELKNPVSLRQITGKQFDVEALGRQLQQDVITSVADWAAQGVTACHTAYQQQLYGLGQVIKLRSGNQVFQTTVTGVSTEGQLQVQDVLARQFAVGQAEWVLPGNN